MTSQQPSLDGTGASLPGPQFVPRPGWGGQLRHYFLQNRRRMFVHLAIVAALVLTSRLLWISRSASPVQSSSQSPIAQQPILLKALPGNGMAHLAGQALDIYLALQSPDTRLNAAQHLFAVDALTRTAGWQPIKRDQEIAFSRTDIAAIVDRALALSPTQQAAWTQLLR